jgi:dUTP pyrophosphatase
MESIVKLSLVRDNAKLPEKAHYNDSGFDAVASEIEVMPDGLIRYKLGFKAEIPEGYEGIIAARSGLTKHRFVVPNGFGLVDEPYRGEWEFRIRPLYVGPDGYRDGCAGRYAMDNLPYKVGERCCQVFFRKREDVIFQIVNELSDTARGEGGFGSTKN